MTDTTTDRIGTPFPALALTSSDGTTRTGLPPAGGATIVHFMRSATCPVCIGHAAVIHQMVQKGALGEVDVVFIAPGGAAEAHDAEARLRGRGVTVYASDDAHGEAGLGRFLALQHSGTFVLDAEGIILSAVTAALPTGSFSRSELTRVLPLTAAG